MAEKQNTPEIRFEGFTDPWEQRKWSEYVSISTDMVDPRSGNYDNLPHVGPGNMESFTGRLYDNVNTVKDDALISGKFHFNPGDIIYGKINPQLGKYTYAQFEGLASADAYVLNGKNGLTQEFLFGILQTKAFFDYSVSVSMRSGMPKINRDELNAFEFLAPNESEQRAIGDILLKLDDLITLHQRKHDKLCTLKKSMLDKMFPKPGETEPEIRFEGFTDPWEQRKFSDMYVVNNERNVNCELGYDRTLSIATMTFNGGNGAADDSLSNYKVIRVGDIAFEGHTNKVHAYGRFVLNDAGDGLMSPRFSCLRPIVEQRYSFWKYYIPREESMRPILVNATKNGTMMNELVPDDLMHESILVPCLAEQEVIGNSFSQLDHVITLHQRKLELLRNIKKSLLDRMFV